MRHVRFAFGTLAVLSVLTGPALAATNLGNCRTLDKAGSYVVTSNINASGDCFVIQADGVSIDLGGHTITGDGTGAAVADQGIARTGIAVSNGTVTGFDDGIDIQVSLACIVENIRAIANDDGMKVGPGSIVRNNVATGNNDEGIRTEDHSLVSHNVALSNGTGIVADENSTVVNNTASLNTAIGIEVDCPANVIDNTAQDNGTDLFLDGACMASGNLAN